MPLNLGSSPEQLVVTLTRGADFVSTLRRKDGTPWPAGSQVILEFTTSVGVTNWPAAISGSTVVWNVDQADVDALVAQRIRGVKLWYVEGELRLLWAQGEVDIRGVG